MDRYAPGDWLIVKQRCEAWLRAGESSKVSLTLASVPTRAWPRQARLPLAHLARRGGFLFLGLRILSPVLQLEPRPDEMAEYGVLLQKIGSTQEALRTLQAIDGERFPESILYQAFCQFTTWDYEASVPLLERYIAHSGVSDYQRVVAQVNLASAFNVLRDFDRALPLLSHVQRKCSENGYGRLLANSLELESQIHVFQRDWPAARKNLDQAKALLLADASFDGLFVSKWLAVVDSLSQEDPNPLYLFQKQALAFGHWESLRESDFYIAKVTQDERVIKKVYFGTPHEKYRQRLLNEFPRIEMSKYFLFGDGEATFDVARGTLDDLEVLKPGKSIHKLLGILFSDLYRAQNLAALFFDLFPGENFDIFSSPNRVHQVIKRARETLTMSKLPIQIDEVKGRYKFALLPGIQLRLELVSKPANSHEVYFRRLIDQFPNGEFSAKAARETLGLSMTTFLRVLDWGLGDGRLIKVGNGPKTRYEIVAENKKSA